MDYIVRSGHRGYGRPTVTVGLNRGQGRCNKRVLQGTFEKQFYYTTHQVGNTADLETQCVVNGAVCDVKVKV